MNGREYWNFLDNWNPNLLYQYARYQGTANQSCHITGDTTETYYLIWFVFRYVLECETYEDALKHADITVFKKYGIADALILHNYEKTEEKKDLVLSIGSEEFGKIIIKISEGNLYKSNKSKQLQGRLQNTIEYLLDIIYHRYNHLEQLECYIRHFSKSGVYPAKQPTAVIEAKKIVKKSVEAMKAYPVLQEVLALHRSTRKDILGEFYYEV